LNAIHILDSIEDKGPKLEAYLVLLNFSSIFPNEMPRFPSKRDIYFTIDCVHGVAPMSKNPYRMSTP